MDEQIRFEFEQRPTIKGFPELRWTGKRPYRGTVYYPAQLRERYGEEQGGWINKIFWGDNLQVMSHLLREFRGKIDLIYIDPPFDSKADYKRKIEVKGIGKAESDSTTFEEKQYGDIWTNDEYLQFMFERLLLMRELLSDTGSIFLHCDWHKSAHLRLIMGEVFGEQNFVNEIIWGYKDVGGGRNNNFYKRKHDTIFWFSKTASYKTGQIARAPLSQSTLDRFGSMFDENGVITYRKFKEMRPAEFATRKKQGRVPDDLDMVFLSKDFGRQMEDYWIDINPLRTRAEKDNPEEVLEYPTQKPNALLERIIMTATVEGDIVFDCFMGSGTTQAVAMKLGRRFLGADINLGAVQTTTKRLIAVAETLKPAEMQQVRMGISRAPEGFTAAAGMGDNGVVDIAAVREYLQSKGLSTNNLPAEDVKYTGFEVYNVNNYDFFRNPIEARELLIQALEIQPFPASDVWDGELDGRMVKIMPVNRIATKADLEELKANLPYRIYERRKEENPNQPVERITIVCMGHEPDLKAALEADLSEYKLDVEIVDILRDRSELQLKREAEADVAIEGGRLVIRAFYPLNLMQKLSLQKDYVEDWRQLVESIMIDWNYDGVVMQPTVMDIPGKNDLVQGLYDIPEDAGTVKIKITDLLSESLEIEVEV